MKCSPSFNSLILQLFPTLSSLCKRLGVEPGAQGFLFCFNSTKNAFALMIFLSMFSNSAQRRELFFLHRRLSKLQVAMDCTLRYEEISLDCGT